MENLIKIQAVINQIEEMTDLRYKTQFDYLDDRNLIIKCYCKEHAMELMMLLSRTRDTCWYFKDNCVIKIYDLISK